VQERAGTSTSEVATGSALSSRAGAADGDLGRLRLVPGPQPAQGAARLLATRGWLATRLLVDASLLTLAIGAAHLGAPDDIGPDGRLLVWMLPPVVMILLALRGLYGNALETRGLDVAGRIAGSTSLAAIALIAAAALFDPSAEPASLIARAWLFATVYLVAGRLLLGAVLRRSRAAGIVGTPTLIVGAGQVGAEMERRLREEPELGLRVVGYLDADPPPAEMVPQRVAPVLGPPSQMMRLARETGAKHVILSFSSAPDHGLVPLVGECEANGIDVSLVPRMFESLTKRLQVETVGTLPLVGLRSVSPLGWRFAVKHVLDRLLAALALLVLGPVLIAAALAVQMESRGPVLFRQRRIGRDGRAFEMLKFRSMAPEEEELAARVLELPPGVAPGGVEGPDRRTAVGRFLRRTSLDELPQLLNVLKGDMSLVGPRPERPEYVELFGETIRRYDDRHRVKSGITGWAQVNGLRGRTSLADRVSWDNYYIQNWSLGLDLKILLLTVTAIFRAPGD
jgi:exopolysaccharide biosynthesis polyprenyl glycosylphosphotransferase